MSPDDLLPITKAITSAMMRGHERPVVVAYLADSPTACAVHEALEGKPMPDVPPPADPHDPRFYLAVKPREQVAAALLHCCGTAGASIAELLDAVTSVSGWLVVLRQDGLGYLGIKGGRPLLEGCVSCEAGPGPVGRDGGDRGRGAPPGRRARRGR
jgi:hypothetical protein